MENRKLDRIINFDDNSRNYPIRTLLASTPILKNKTTR